MSDMTVKVILDLVDKLSQKKGKAERSAKDLKRSMDRLRGDNSGLAGSEDKLARSAGRAADAERGKAAALDKASSAARKHKSELSQLERTQDNLNRKAKRAASYDGGTGGSAGTKWGKAKGLGLAAAGGLGLGAMTGGATIAGTAMGAAIGKAFLEAGSDEFAKDQLQVLAGMTDAQFAQYDAYLKSVGARRGTGTKGAYGVFGEMMMGGMDARAARDLTEPVIFFAQATQAAGEDAARTAIALANNLKIAPEQMMAAFDAMATGAKEGQYEIRDMARDFPSLAAQMAGLGSTGLEAVSTLTSALEIVRSVSGSADETATRMQNLLTKLSSKDLRDNAKDFGIDLAKTMDDAKKNGLDPVLEAVREIKKVLGNDNKKLSELLPDAQANPALTALINQLDEWEAKNKRAGDSAGTVMKDYVIATDNASAAWDRFSANVAEKAKHIAGKALPAVTKAMNTLSEAMEMNKDDSFVPFKAPDGMSNKAKKAVAAANDRGARMNRAVENMLGWTPSQGSKDLNVEDGYRQYYDSLRNGEKARKAKIIGDARAERARRIGALTDGSGSGMSAITDAVQAQEKAAAQSAAAHKAVIDKMLSGIDALAARLKSAEKVDGALTPVPGVRPDKSMPANIHKPTPRPSNGPQAALGAVQGQIDAAAPKITAEVAASELSKIFQSFAKGGQKAADTVSNGAESAGDRLGQSANAKIAAGASAAGDAFGAAAAARIAAAAANIRVTASPAAAARTTGTAPLTRVQTGALHGGLE